MKCYNTHEAKTQLSKILLHIEQTGETVQICRNGLPIAEMHAISSRGHNPLAQSDDLKGISLHYDPTEPLQNDEWPDINLDVS
jgi:antitoxin (DNA-binding transcriptional repressor) of toxin-antitoxin stability system